MTPSALELAQRYYRAWNARDPQAIAGFFAPGGYYSDPSTPQTIPAAEIAPFTTALFTAYPDLKFYVKQLLAEGETVMARWMMHGTHSGPMGDTPATHRLVELGGMDYLQIEGDQVHAHYRAYDQATLLRQLGYRVAPLPEQPLGPLAFSSTVTFTTPAQATPQALFTLTAFLPPNTDATSRANLAAELLSGLRSLPALQQLSVSEGPDRVQIQAGWHTLAAAQTALAAAQQAVTQAGFHHAVALWQPAKTA